MVSPRSRSASTSIISRVASYMPLAESMEHRLIRNWNSSSLRMISCNYTWSIHNFSYQVSNKEMLKSLPFSAGTDNAIMWQLHLHPNGDGEQNRGYLSLFLCLKESNSLEISAVFEFAIIDAGGKRTNAVSTRHNFKRENGRWGSWGHKKYISVATLMNAKKKLLSNDTLTILCEVKVFTETVKAARQGTTIPRSDEVACSLSDDLSLMFQNKEFSDVLFTVSDEKFYAHKAILSARSPVFSAMFRQEASRAQRLQMVNLSNVKKDVFAEMLRFVYTGKAPNLASFPRDLLTVAHDYKVDRLKSMCELQLCKNLTTKNAADVLMLAELHDAKQLKERTKDFIILHVEEVKNTESFKHMAQSHASLMIELVSNLAKKINARFG